MSSADKTSEAGPGRKTMSLGVPQFQQAARPQFVGNDGISLPVIYRGASIDADNKRYEFYVCGCVVIARYGSFQSNRYLSSSRIAPLTKLTGPARIRAKQLVSETLKGRGEPGRGT